MKIKRLLGIGLALALLLAAAGASAAEFYLRAAPVTNAMPNNGGLRAQWGFARDTAFGARDGAVTIPGPVLVVPPGDTTLTVHLDNDLPEPTSLVIPGQPVAAGQAPVRNGHGRITAFTHETPPGNGAPVDYVWTGLRPGTYLYHSGSHPALQRPMGLFGALVHDFQAGLAYSNVVYDRDVLLVYSEIDSRLNQAVAHGNFGPGRMMTSTVDYQPGYYLLNGQDFSNGVWSTAAGAGERILFRLINAGSRLRMPVLNGAYAQVCAEDGFGYPFPGRQYSFQLPPHKTLDVLLTNGAAPTLTWYDRRAVSNPPQPLDSNNNGLPDDWETSWFGDYTNGVPDADPDGDGFSNLQEYVADTRPLDGQSYVRIIGISVDDQGEHVSVGSASAARIYKLLSRDGLAYGSGAWQAASGYEPGAADTVVLSGTNASANRFRAYKVDVDLP